MADIDPKESSVNIVDYLFEALRHKSLIIKTTLGAAVIGVVVSLLLPSVYLAEAKILPPQTSGATMASAFAAQIGSLGFSPAGMGVKTASDMYVALLKTRPVLDFVLEKTSFMKENRIKSMTVARRNLIASLSVVDNKRSGIITIGVMNRNPQVAADVANAFVDGLQNLNNTLAVTEASQRRLYFETQLKRSQENLIRSEDALKNFQQRTGTIKIDEEARAAVETVSEMRARLSAKEVQLRVMNSYATPQNPDIQRLKDEISALKNELQKFGSNGSLDDNSLPTVGSISSMGTEYLRRMREFKYNETLYEILMKQYGMAKLDEAKDAAMVQVVEFAIPPEQRIKPVRSRVVLNSMLFGFFAAIVFVFMRNYWRALKTDPESAKKLSDLMALLDFSSLSRELGLVHLLGLFKRGKFSR